MPADNKQLNRSDTKERAQGAYEPPRIQSEKVFETHSLVSCGKVDAGCMPGGGPPDGIMDS